MQVLELVPPAPLALIPLVVRQPLTPDALTAVLRLIMEAAERGEPCPIQVAAK